MQRQHSNINVPLFSRTNSLQTYIYAGQKREEESCSTNISTKQTLNNIDNLPPESLSSFSNGDFTDIEEIQMRRVSSRFSGNGDVNGIYQGETYETLEPIDFECITLILRNSYIFQT